MDAESGARASTPTARISVVVPAYNASATLRETLDSVAAQEFDAWECIVVDDGSTDDTAAIVEAFVERDPRFRLVRQENRGTAGAYRTGVEAARAELIAICGADDLLLPRHLAVMDELARRHPECAIYSSNGEFLDHDTGARTIVYTSEEWARERSLSLVEVIAECFFSTGAVFRRHLYELTGGHRPGVYVDDYDLWLRAMARGARHCYTPEVLAVSRVSNFQQSANRARVIEADAAVYRNLLETEPVGPAERVALEQALERCRTRRAEATLEQQGRSLRRSIERVVGPRSAGVMLRAVHVVSGATRPLRRALARRATARADETRGERGGAAGTAESPPRKVLIVAGWYPHEASPLAGVFIREQAEALATRCDVAVLYVGFGSEPHAATVTREGALTVCRATVAPRRFAARRLQDYANLFALTLGHRAAVLRAYGALRESWGTPDLVHAHVLYPGGFGGWLLTRAYRVPYVVTEHSSETLPADGGFARRGRVIRWLMRRAAARAVQVIAVSTAQAHSLESQGLGRSVLVVPNIVSDCPGDIEAAAGEPKRIVHVSLMSDFSKDISGLLEAARILRARREDFVLTLVGDGEDRDRMESLAAEHGLLGTCVEFAGRLDRTAVNRLFARACCSVVSSRFETFSMAAAESLMCGVPVVSTRCGGPEDFVDDRVGRLVPVGDPGALAAALDHVLDHCGEYDRAAIARYARARFAPDVVLDSLERVYLRATAASRS